MTDQPVDYVVVVVPDGGGSSTFLHVRPSDADAVVQAVQAAVASDQPETITVPVEVLRRLHADATRHAFSHGQGWMVDPFGVHYWPTFLARLREQAT